MLCPILEIEDILSNMMSNIWNWR